MYNGLKHSKIVKIKHAMFRLNINLASFEKKQAIDIIFSRAIVFRIVSE